jgi:hypothetical protein
LTSGRGKSLKALPDNRAGRDDYDISAALMSHDWRRNQ